MPTAIYTRISDDRTGRAAGVQRQETESRTLCERRGWPIGDIYIDNDRSAYSGKPRPDYRRLCADVAAGKVQRIVSWHPDRLHRSPRELEDFIDLIDEHKVQIGTVQSGDWDLSTPSGRLHARMLGAVARYESEHKSDRVKSALAQNAADGRHHGGTRPYGYTVDRTVIDHEADVIRHMARRILAGDSLRSICRTLTADDEPTVTGADWTPTTVRQVLIRPRTAGLRAHHGNIVGPGNWQPILDADTYNAVKTILTDANRGQGQTSARVHLLSNLARCGLCDAGLLPHHTRSRGTLDIYYHCRACRRISIRLLLLDEYVTEAALVRLETARVAVDDPDPDDGGLAEQIAVLHARREQAAESFADDPDVTPDMLRALIRRLTVRIAALEDQQAQTRGDTVLRSLSGTDLRAEWAGADLSRRRAILLAVFDRIVVHPSDGGRVFNPARVELGYR